MSPARSEMSTSLPTTLTRSALAVSAIVSGLSTCEAMTSIPCVAKARVASASRSGSHHAPVHTAVVVASGFTDCAPCMKTLIVRKSCGIWNAANHLTFLDYPCPVPPERLDLDFR
jgi:hypothetical protein